MERQLSGWTPRRPSEHIERDLFERAPVAVVERPRTIDVWRQGIARLLGPAGAMAMVFAVMIFQAPSPAVSSMLAVETADGMALLSMSETLPAQYHHSVLNHCDYPIFGWTNSALPPEGIAHFRK